MSADLRTPFELGHLRFITTGTYRRVPVFSIPKLDYMHNNPVKRRLVASPADWPWSSWRFYFLGDRSLLEMDRIG